MTHIFAVPGMTCRACERMVKQVLLCMDDVIEVETALQPFSRVEITMEQHIDIQTLNAELVRVAKGKYMLAQDLHRYDMHGYDASAHGAMSMHSEGDLV